MPCLAKLHLCYWTLYRKSVLTLTFTPDMYQAWKLLFMPSQQEKAEQTENQWLFLESSEG